MRTTDEMQGEDDYYTLEDSGFFTGPYGVMRILGKSASIERYQPVSKTWVPDQREGAQMLFFPDPGERANPITEEQCQKLIDSGTLRNWS